MGKILSISLKLKFTPNTLGCYGLSKEVCFAAIATTLGAASNVSNDR